jgi:FKBP-type peptidyl-prolyl cis-trans isomerase 2
MPQARKGDRVKVTYRGTLDDGSVFDSSEGKDPLEFIIGEGNLIPAFEEAVAGLTRGERTTTRVPAANAYGERNEEMVFEVEKSFLPDNIDPQVGQSLKLKKDDGSAVPVSITAVTDGKVTIDANHPLAGMDLTFEIELMAIAKRPDKEGQ